MASPWASPEELRAHLRLTVIDEEQAAEKIAAAETVIRAELRQSIDAVAGDAVDLVGNGRTIINLPHLPVTAVASVTVDGHAPLISTEYRWNRYGILTRLGGCWPLDAVITVLCDHGYALTPAPVKQVCLQVAGRAWVRPSTGYQRSLSGTGR
ncbi:hypothetical protein Sfulv_18050 [Streptomyces fulvorobeus]|uniref:Uncharacterized protein n=1 Tax=Streptomyces fulvorobeus TaxID=284028 RepID=A0A7J0C4X4_9ACTN|nr:hypothetical protein [Streptomyces fulvorobeus]GFM96994.1 hypothetical protein Sfulv_18050 [Streptomyces fulvorobeus]